LPYQLLLLRDPIRRPADWNDHIGPEQRAVFLSDVRSGHESTLDGQFLPRTAPSFCLVFESMDEAKAFCVELVARVEHMKCDIYDRRGAAVGPIRSFVNQRFRRRAPSSRGAYKLVVAGCLLILICPLFIWWDWRHSGILVFPTLIGLNCFLGALRLFQLAHATLHAARSLEQDET
jgi:hypothetical protein